MEVIYRVLSKNTVINMLDINISPALLLELIQMGLLKPKQSKLKLKTQTYHSLGTEDFIAYHSIC